MKKLLLQLGKKSRICNNIEEAKDFVAKFGHLTSAGEKRLIGLFEGKISITRDFSWLNPKHIPELKDFSEQSCRMWVKPYPQKKYIPISYAEVKKAVENM